MRMLRGIRILVLVCAVAACTNEASVSPDGGAVATPQSIVTAHLGPHLGMTMTPAVRTCRETCWAQIPFNECAKQRDACLDTATSKGEKHHCRQMSLACGQLRRECMQGCWLGKVPSTNPLAEQETTRLTSAEKHLGMQMTPEVKSCRKGCWAKTPFNACAKQRDACLATASGDDDRHQCRVSSMGCRRERTQCMQSCWVGDQPASEQLPDGDSADGE
ncbi:MAG TPA: hypothetical protein VH143_04610 [Kofleriaceae bacterium]|nr:hypothetical protein [Kofleriaceae bacterium]